MYTSPKRLNTLRATTCFQDLLKNSLTNNVVFSRTLVGCLFYSSRGHTETNVASEIMSSVISYKKQRYSNFKSVCLKNVSGIIIKRWVSFCGVLTRFLAHERFCKC